MLFAVAAAIMVLSGISSGTPAGGDAAAAFDDVAALLAQLESNETSANAEACTPEAEAAMMADTWRCARYACSRASQNI